MPLWAVCKQHNAEAVRVQIFHLLEENVLSIYMQINVKRSELRNEDTLKAPKLLHESIGILCGGR